ncbi:hypothetical protein [Thermobifida cellulosilytica]|uniref:Integral membrane protein n=1 Tax=Thermobifida cellulosilytica TB100 TaxID=665004 RepID=A0A147KCZ8_THECS|nr:hypothetical protein [Thermobifida cellulosilytica]KUP95137.1 hypothetical protein AC529_19210 [Thermobifida cellulosilytica TB100]
MAQKLPRSVLWLRILLFVVAGLTFVFSAALFVLLGSSAEAFGHALFTSLPGAVQLLWGLFVPRGGRAVFYGVLLTEVLLVLHTLLTLPGEGRIGQLLFPVAILALLSRPSARNFFLAKDD